MEENIKNEDVLLESTTNQIEKIQATVNKIDLDLISKYQTIAPKSENLKNILKRVRYIKEQKFEKEGIEMIPDLEKNIKWADNLAGSINHVVNHIGVVEEKDKEYWINIANELGGFVGKKFKIFSAEEIKAYFESQRAEKQKGKIFKSVETIEKADGQFVVVCKRCRSELTPFKETLSFTETAELVENHTHQNIVGVIKESVKQIDLDSVKYPDEYKKTVEFINLKIQNINSSTITDREIVSNARQITARLDSFIAVIDKDGDEEKKLIKLATEFRKLALSDLLGEQVKKLDGIEKTDNNKNQPIVLLDEVEKSTEYDAHFKPKLKNAVACFVCNQIKDILYFHDNLRKIKHLPNSICEECLPKRLEELKQGTVREDEIINPTFSNSDTSPIVDKTKEDIEEKTETAIDKFNQRATKVKEKRKQEKKEKPHEEIEKVELIEIDCDNHPFLKEFKKVNVTETNKTKQLVHDEDANHRESYCSYCDSQKVVYEVRDKRTSDLKARLCEDCYENKWDVEWDSRCGGEFHKL